MNITEKYGFCEDCRKIRQAVFVEEQGFTGEFDEIDSRAEHVVLYDGQTPVATGRVFASESGAPDFTIGRVAVIKDYRKKRLGRRVMQSLIKTARSLGARSVEVSAQLQAEGFYSSLGFEPCSEKYFDEHCPHRRMVKRL